jgi:hypothetical protein
MHMVCTSGDPLWIVCEGGESDGSGRPPSVVTCPRVGANDQALHPCVATRLRRPTRLSQHRHGRAILADLTDTEPRLHQGSGRPVRQRDRYNSATGTTEWGHDEALG